VPLLTRMVGMPLAVEVRPGAVDALGPLLSDRRISSGGQVAVVVGTGLGEEIAGKLAGQLPDAEIRHVDGGSVETAMELAKELRSGFYDAIVGIGGGRTLDTAKYAASLSGLPLVAVATSLAHDGIASPVSSLYEENGRKTSLGVMMPIAVVVDLDYVRRSAPEMRRSGVGDALSNLSAIADWRLAGRERGEVVDGVAVTFAQTAALAVLHRTDSIDDQEFLMALADALVLSGLAMATAGSSRPCSGSDHEIVHAIDHLFPGETVNHGELAGAAALFTTWLRGDERLAAELNVCLVRHGLPRMPKDLGLTEQQFVAAVVEAPNTRPDRFTILEHLDLDEEGVRSRVRAFLEAFGR
jgi:glycerol-1-phosphate dehydrogenase [NAD(P)+]